ncbi:MAG: hypothetical protein WA581_14945, partial [Candidatus Acidiferrales bacterium]
MASARPRFLRQAGLVLLILLAASSASRAQTISVAVSPNLGGATITQQIQLTATVTNDVGAAGVSWSVSAGGTLTGQTTTAATFSAATAGVYT